MPVQMHLRIAKSLWPKSIALALICSALSPGASTGTSAQTATDAPHVISISFIEIQTEAAETPRIMRQRNAVRLTLRSPIHFDFERERNTGSISKAYTYRTATGTAGQWLEVSHGSRLRVTTAPRAIVIEQHGSNFTQRFTVTVSGNACKAAIYYAADPGPEQPPVFKMTEILTKKPLRLASLAATEITCSVGGVALY